MQEFVDHAVRCLPRYGSIVGVTPGALQPGHGPVRAFFPRRRDHDEADRMSGSIELISVNFFYIAAGHERPPGEEAYD
jgi:hypothetical protein